MTETARNGGQRSRLHRQKTSEAVIAYLVRAMLAGRLRPGERIDIDEIAAELGVSRIPVREALLLMERDGLVDTRLHRGVHVGQFDRAAIHDHFELYGILGGVAAGRFAERPATKAQIEELEEILAELEGIPMADAVGWEVRLRDFIRVIFTSAAGPRLRSTLASFAHFVPYAYEIIMPTANVQAKEAMQAELAAIKAGDAERVATLFERHMRNLEEMVVAELEVRGVLAPHGEHHGPGRTGG